jgi:hypothetical protein
MGFDSGSRNLHHRKRQTGAIRAYNAAHGLLHAYQGTIQLGRFSTPKRTNACRDCAPPIEKVLLPKMRRDRRLCIHSRCDTRSVITRVWGRHSGGKPACGRRVGYAPERKEARSQRSCRQSAGPHAGVFKR